MSRLSAVSEAAWLVGPAGGAGLVVRVLVTPAAVMRWTPGQVGQSLLSSNAEWLTNQVMHLPPLCTFYVYISSSVDRCRSHSRLLRLNWAGNQGGGPTAKQQRRRQPGPRTADSEATPRTGFVQNGLLESHSPLGSNNSFLRENQCIIKT